MKKIILTVIATILVLCIGFLIYIVSGCYDISQLTPHNKLTRWIIHITTDNSVAHRMKGEVVPNLADTSMIATGFAHYDAMCACCHGAPGVEPWEMVKGLYPDPPELARFSNRLNPQESFWITKNGIKMTSMPAFGPSHSDDKIWAIIAFLNQKLATITPEEYQAWKVKYGKLAEE